jgi:hypothetical protein
MGFAMAAERCVVEKGVWSLGKQVHVMVKHVFTGMKCAMELVNRVGKFHVEIVVLAKMDLVKEDAMTMSIHSCVWDIMGRHVFLLRRLEMEKKIVKMDLMKQQVVSRDGDAMEFYNASTNHAMIMDPVKRSAQQV